ncbi:MAG: hypothetical protein KY475_06735 [Planctomycetes bacterium]|nr:hypothetical protein [Planctomycetota bacterium]
MKRVTGWNDLNAYGIVLLTGESCGLMYRILFDCTEQGRRIIGKCLGIPDLQLAEAWNRGSDDDRHVGSILLAPEMLTPLGIFALLDAGCTEVWLYRNGSLLGVEPADTAEHVELCRRMAPEALARVFAARGTAGDRNVHQMTGRIT